MVSSTALTQSSCLRGVPMWTCSTVSRRKVIEYCAKYATKSEPRFQTLKDIFATIVRSLNEDNSSLKAVQKLLISSVGERDFSAQETCHLLLQLPMFKASRDFVIVSLNGSRSVDEHLDEEQPVTVKSALDHYISRPATTQFETMTLLHFVQQYSMPRESSTEPSKRRKKVVVIVRPYCIPDPCGPKYEQYCQQSSCFMCHFAIRVNYSATTPPSLLPTPPSSCQVAFHHLWRMTSTDFSSCLMNIQRMILSM